MHCPELPLTNSIWSPLLSDFRQGFFHSSKKEVYWLQLSKNCGNIVYRAVLLLTMLVVAVATPILALLDIGFSKKAVNHSILDFYQGKANNRGVHLEEIWRWDYKRLEDQHDYIQYLFPLFTKSAFNPSAPVSNSSVMTQFNQEKILRDKMLKSFQVMLHFYGLELDGQKVKIGPNFAERKKNWIQPGNHNFLRITRILNSLCLHGLKSYADSFLKTLEGIYKNHLELIAKNTFGHWQRAVQ